MVVGLFVGFGGFSGALNVAGLAVLMDEQSGLAAVRKYQIVDATFHKGGMVGVAQHFQHFFALGVRNAAGDPQAFQHAVELDRGYPAATKTGEPLGYRFVVPRASVYSP